MRETVVCPEIAPVTPVFGKSVLGKTNAHNGTLGKYKQSRSTHNSTQQKTLTEVSGDDDDGAFLPVRE